MEAGWMGVVVLVAILAHNAVYHLRRATPADKVLAPALDQLKMEFSKWPDPGEVLERLEDIETRLKSLESSGTSMKSVVEVANNHTKGLLELKTLVAEHRDLLNLLRSKNSLRALSGVE